jgi:uncharacterized OsmC-like protein
MDIKVEGAFDIETLLGKSKESRAGFNGIKVTLNIDSGMSKEDKEAFVQEVESRCPVSDNIANTTPIVIEVV